MLFRFHQQSLGLINGIFATSLGTVVMSNNIGAISTNAATAAIGYTFNGVYTAGAGGNFTVSNNTIGSASTTNSSIGSGSTTAICTMRGIYNTATGAISLTGNTIQNCSVYGTGASVLYGIWNTGGSGTVDINTNKIISCSNTGTGILWELLILQ
jgi:hypothetical protein